MSAQYHVCPVCYYGLLTEPPEDYTICPSCGTEFELDDRSKPHAALRREWLDAGAPWFSSRVPKPAEWDTFTAQLLASRANPTTDGWTPMILASPTVAGDMMTLRTV